MSEESGYEEYHVVQANNILSSIASQNQEDISLSLIYHFLLFPKQQLLLCMLHMFRKLMW